MFYKRIEDGILTMVGESSSIGEGDIEITKVEYNEVISIIRSKPEDTEEVVYKLVSDTMTYEEFEPEPIIEPNNDFGISNELYDAIIDEYTMQLIEEGAF